VLNTVLIIRVSKNSITLSQFLWYVCVKFYNRKGFLRCYSECSEYKSFTGDIMVSE